MQFVVERAAVETALCECLNRFNDRDRGAPHAAAPLTPQGIRVTYHGDSTGLILGGDMKSREAEGVESVVAQPNVRFWL